MDDRDTRDTDVLNNKYQYHHYYKERKERRERKGHTETKDQTRENYEPMKGKEGEGCDFRYLEE